MQLCKWEWDYLIYIYTYLEPAQPGRNDSTLSIKADKPPEKEKDRQKKKNKDHLARRQFILSFSPKKWKVI
jgi:hypothetical protein